MTYFPTGPKREYKPKPVDADDDQVLTHTELNMIGEDIEGLLSGYLPIEVTGDRAITTADTQKALWFKGIGSLLTLTVNTGSLAIGKDLEVHVGDSDGFDFVGGAGANVIGNITGSTTESDTVGLRRLADASFGLIGEVYKVI